MTKGQLRSLLEKEINAWEQKIDELEGPLKEQAIGRYLECKWLLDVFQGKSDANG